MLKCYRKILDNPISKKPSWAWLWVVILLKVNHTNSEFIFNGSKECVKRGEFITGRKQLSIDTGISESTVENILKYLESEHQIEQQKTSKFRRIKVINYDMYQNNEQHFEQQIDNKLTTNKQQIDTNNNDNKEDNEKNEEEENSTNLFLNKKRSEEIKEITKDIIWLPPTIDELATFPSSVAGQLFAYYIAKCRGTDIDQPKNLAKSVTVE